MRPKSTLFRALGTGFLWVWVGLACALVWPGAAEAGHINRIVVDGSINPASADYIMQAIETSERDGASAVLIELDTPGGLVSSSQDIIKAMLNAKVPIIVFVTPRGAWAASAGTFITIAANVAAMTPGSSIGAAHPVGLGGSGGGQGEDEEGKAARDVSMEKAENLLAAYMESIAKERERNVEWAVDAVRNSVAVDAEEALELGVIDLIAEDRQELLAAIDGREVKVAGDPVTLELANAEVRLLEMTILQGIFNFLADPNVAVILMLAGLMGLYIEFNNPGLILPGVVGAVCLVLTGFALQILPFSWVGLMLILVGLGLLMAEMFVTSYGALFAAGIACFLLGGTMVFDAPEVSDLNVDFWSVLLPSVLGLASFGGALVFLVGRSMLREQTAGVDEMVGLVGQASTSLSPEGKIFIRGEYWNVESDQTIEAGEPVEVVAVNGLKLRVRRASQPR
ncbi:MAG: nodulation protein NfeD [Deltaproteobacteria bacterium]|nr:nodulation protein NfeD [Deltaproteobacteria bacterium]